MYVLRQGVGVQIEGNLGKLISPDRWCCLEAMWAGEARLRALGCHKPGCLAVITPDRMRLIRQFLSHDEVIPGSFHAPLQHALAVAIVSCRGSCHLRFGFALPA